MFPACTLWYINPHTEAVKSEGTHRTFFNLVERKSLKMITGKKINGKN